MGPPADSKLNLQVRRSAFAVRCSAGNIRFLVETSGQENVKDAVPVEAKAEVGRRKAEELLNRVDGGLS